MRPYPSSSSTAFFTLATEFSTRQSALPVTPSVSADKKVHEALEHEALVSRGCPSPLPVTHLWRYATLEKAASGFIATCHVRKADGKIPFPTHTVVQAAAVAGCDGIRDAPFRQILRQRRAEQRSDLHILKNGFGRLREIGGLFPSGNRHIGGFRYELRLLHKVIALQQTPRQA